MGRGQEGKKWGEARSSSAGYGLVSVGLAEVVADAEEGAVGLEHRRHHGHGGGKVRPQEGGAGCLERAAVTLGFEATAEEAAGHEHATEEAAEVRRPIHVRHLDAPRDDNNATHKRTHAR